MDNPVEIMQTQLPLPNSFLEVLKGPFLEMGFQIEMGTILIWPPKPASYHKAAARGGDIVLLHIGEEFTKNPMGKQILVMSGALFAGKAIGLFVISDSSVGTEEYKRYLPGLWMQQIAGLRKADFFYKDDIDVLRDTDDEGKKNLLRLLFGLSQLFQSPASKSVGDLMQGEKDCIIEMLASRADGFADPNLFFRNLVRQLSFPPGWSFTATGNPPIDARELVEYVIQQKNYPDVVRNRRGYTVLGCLLEKFIPQVGGEAQQTLYDLIATYNLIEIDAVNDSGQNARELLKPN